MYAKQADRLCQLLLRNRPRMRPSLSLVLLALWVGVGCEEANATDWPAIDDWNDADFDIERSLKMQHEAVLQEFIDASAAKGKEITREAAQGIYEGFAAMPRLDAWAAMKLMSYIVRQQTGPGPWALFGDANLLAQALVEIGKAEAPAVEEECSNALYVYLDALERAEK